MAGQSVGMVNDEQPTAQIIQELVGQALAALSTRDDAEKERIEAVG